MQLKEVTEALARLTAALSSSEDRTAVEGALNVLLKLDEHTKAALNATLKMRRSTKTASGKPTKERKPKAEAINAELVTSYVSALEESMLDAARFKSVLSDLRANKLVKAGEVSAILSQVRGREVKCSKKADGLKEIEQWFQRRRDTERRVRGADEIY
jgi:hypothetical protein